MADYFLSVSKSNIGSNLNVMRQYACLVDKQITVDNFATLFNCTPVDRVSGSMMTPTKSCPRLRFFIVRVLNRDLFVNRDDSLTS